MEKRRNWAISPLFHNIFNISLTSGVKLHIYLRNIVVRFIFSWPLQVLYVEIRISRSILDSPLDFEITSVDCISLDFTNWWSSRKFSRPYWNFLTHLFTVGYNKDSSTQFLLTLASERYTTYFDIGHLWVQNNSIADMNTLHFAKICKFLWRHSWYLTNSKSTKILCIRVKIIKKKEKMPKTESRMFTFVCTYANMTSLVTPWLFCAFKGEYPIFLSATIFKFRMRNCVSNNFYRFL